MYFIWYSTHILVYHTKYHGAVVYLLAFLFHSFLSFSLSLYFFLFRLFILYMKNSIIWRYWNAFLLIQTTVHNIFYRGLIMYREKAYERKITASNLGKIEPKNEKNFCMRSTKVKYIQPTDKLNRKVNRNNGKFCSPNQKHRTFYYKNKKLFLFRITRTKTKSKLLRSGTSFPGKRGGSKQKLWNNMKQMSSIIWNSYYGYQVMRFKANA